MLDRFILFMVYIELISYTL